MIQNGEESASPRFEYFDSILATSTELWFFQSVGWVHYEVHEPEPHVVRPSSLPLALDSRRRDPQLLFRRELNYQQKCTLPPSSCSRIQLIDVVQTVTRGNRKINRHNHHPSILIPISTSLILYPTNSSLDHTLFILPYPSIPSNNPSFISFLCAVIKSCNHLSSSPLSQSRSKCERYERAREKRRGRERMCIKE